MTLRYLVDLSMFIFVKLRSTVISDPCCSIFIKGLHLPYYVSVKRPIIFVKTPLNLHILSTFSYILFLGIKCIYSSVYCIKRLLIEASQSIKLVFCTMIFIFWQKVKYSYKYRMTDRKDDMKTTLSH